MICIEHANNHEIRIDRNEVLRYLGYGKNTADGITAGMIEECTADIERLLSCRACYDRFPLCIEPCGALNIGFGSICSEALKKNLGGCGEVILFTATIGIETDRFIGKYSGVSPARAVIAQAAGAAAIEEWCDIFCSRLAERELKNGNYLRPRFSPGYGDFPLESQKQIFKVLDCSRKIGVTLTDSCLMLPSKSVSAVIGLSKTNSGCTHSGCEVCKNTECKFRRS